jgi:hypothetical protein
MARNAMHALSVDFQRDELRVRMHLANVWAALELTGEEIFHGFNQIRKAL